MPRNSKGQFTSSSDLSIPLPGFIGIYKILFFAALIFPWYVIVTRHNYMTWLFDYLVGTGTCKPCPECPKAQECPKCTSTPLS